NQYLKDIVSSGRHLARIVDDTLNLSKISAGRLSLKMECVDLGSILQSAQSTFETLAAAADVVLQIELSAASAWIHADAVWIHQAIQNVVSNAVKFSTAGEVVRLICRAAGTEASIEVIDTGIGIPADELPRVTQAFYQVHNALDRTNGGLGLG